MINVFCIVSYCRLEIPLQERKKEKLNCDVMNNTDCQGIGETECV